MENILEKYKIIRYKIDNDNNGHHKIGCLILDKSYRNLYSFGYNKYNIDKFNRSLHAEEDAINKLRFTNKNKKVNILIFRISNDCKKIMLGEPCYKCINIINEGLKYKGYNLNKLFCTDINGEIIKKNIKRIC